MRTISRRCDIGDGDGDADCTDARTRTADGLLTALRWLQILADANNMSDADGDTESGSKSGSKSSGGLLSAKMNETANVRILGVADILRRQYASQGRTYSLTLRYCQSVVY